MDENGGDQEKDGKMMNMLVMLDLHGGFEQ